MANRSTINSVLPRDIKRFIDLTPGDAHHIGAIRRLFIEAHSHHRKVRNDRLTQKMAADDTVEDATTST